MIVISSSTRVVKPVKWGLYDTFSNSWMGDHKGPLSYKDIELAQAAASILGVRLQSAASRIKVLPIDQKITRRTDALIPKISAEEAILLIEQEESEND